MTKTLTKTTSTPNIKTPVLSSKDKAQIVCQTALDQKAHQLKAFHVQGQSQFADYYVVMTATSRTHAQGLCDTISKKFPKHQCKEEGYQNAQWILLDVSDVIVHIFLEDIREHYNFDKLWGHVPCDEIDDDAQTVQLSS